MKYFHSNTKFLSKLSPSFHDPHEKILEKDDNKVPVIKKRQRITILFLVMMPFDCTPIVINGCLRRSLGCAFSCDTLRLSQTSDREKISKDRVYHHVNLSTICICMIHPAPIDSFIHSCVHSCTICLNEWLGQIMKLALIQKAIQFSDKQERLKKRLLLRVDKVHLGSDQIRTPCCRYRLTRLLRVCLV